MRVEARQAVVTKIKSGGNEFISRKKADNPNESPWCSTDVDERGYHVIGGFSYCEEGCPKDLPNTCYGK